MLHKLIKYFIVHKLVAFVLLVVLLVWGLVNSPFQLGGILVALNPVSVDAIPNLGENQQIIFTEWEGQSPQDIENQITYPLTSNLLGLPGVKSIRSSSMYGYSSIYVVFEDDIDFYWSRSRILEKLNSLPDHILPKGVVAKLGPDATALGQLFWYTLEGRDESGQVTGGWSLHELRSIQDFMVRNSLASVSNVSEVASIGGYVQEYQIELKPELMQQYGVSLKDVMTAAKESNMDVSAKTIEINRAEYFVRGLGYITDVKDLENTTVSYNSFTPIKIKDVAKVSLGPKDRRGILDKEGAEVVGGVVVSRYGANPVEVIDGIKKKIKEISRALPSKILKDGRKSQLTIVPFYDRSELIENTISTLEDSLKLEILITILVVFLMLNNLRISFVISSLLPVAVLMVFIAMKIFKVEANIVSLSGIAIAIGTIVDLGIILTENITRHLKNKKETDSIDEVIYNGTIEVSGAIITAGLTTIISFIPVFVLNGPEGKLFTPLAFTKTAALFSALFITLFIIPACIGKWYTLGYMGKFSKFSKAVLLGFSGVLLLFLGYWIGWVLIGFFLLTTLFKYGYFSEEKFTDFKHYLFVVTVLLLLTYYWRPLGYGSSFLASLMFIFVSASYILGVLFLFKFYYEGILRWALANKILFLSLPASLLIMGILVFSRMGKEFMPTLDEGSFLLMPTAMPHAGISENKRILQQLDMAVISLPEIETIVGKAGRVNSALDPAPMSMFENLISYKPEYILNENGRPKTFQTNEKGLFKTKKGKWVAAASGVVEEELIEDSSGEFYRNWRPKIKSKEDIWNEIVAVTNVPGVTTAPKLQPIETRLVMLQTGMRAPMGIKVFGEDLTSIEKFGLAVEKILKEAPSVESASVFADRVIGKPYLIIDINRQKIARYGLSIENVQNALETAVGGKKVTQTVEGRERYDVVVRYPRELRASPSDLEKIYLTLENGGSLPLAEVANIRYERGPQSIKSEDGFLTGYVLFDKKSNKSEVDVIEEANLLIETSIKNGDLVVPTGVSYKFSGTYENQLHAERTLSFVIPLVFLAILFILYMQFKSVKFSLMIFTGVAVSFSGGFLMLWLYGQDWFLNVELATFNLRDLFNVQTVNLSVAVWVGFIALFGIATDDGVVIATYLKQSFNKALPTTVSKIHDKVLEAGKKRLRPCIMTTATTLLALLPILTSKGQGKDIMIPMAIPAFGGMLVALVSLLVVPVLFSFWKEQNLKKVNT